jgi:drug/metabolite transporter (DMT)-like permease
VENPPAPVPLLLRGLIASCFAFVSFGSVMLATRLDSVGEAAALRETSVIFAAVFGWLFLKEKVGPIRGGLMVLIALGAVLVEFG